MGIGVGLLAVGDYRYYTMALRFIKTCVLYLRPNRLLTTGKRSYYGKNRYLLAEVYGDYIGNCFVPLMEIHLNQEQRDNIVLVETIPDDS